MKLKKIFPVLLLGLAIGTLVGCGPTEEVSGDLVTPPTYDENSIQLHYYRKDRKFDGWALWLWSANAEGKEFDFNGVDEYGAVASYALSSFGASVKTDGLGFIVKSKGSWSAKDPDGDRFVDFSNIEKDEKNIYHVYLKTGDENIYTTADWVIADAFVSAKFTSNRQIICETNNKISSYKIYEDEEVLSSVNLTPSTNAFRYSFPTGKNASFDKKYTVEATFEDSKKSIKANISVRTLYSTNDFNNQYTYNGKLGVEYLNSESTFRVWSPISSKIVLKIYNNGTPKSVSSTLGSDTVYLSVDMVKGEKGVFSTTINEDLAGKYYTYVVSNSQFTNKEIIDPYAKSCGVNGLRGMIVDFSQTNPDNWNEVEPLQIDKKALTVYETHVSDISSSSTWVGTEANRKKFAGAYEGNTTYTSGDVTVKTGFDHIKELGVNAVQLIPVFDQANDETNMTFNWGYNPLNYNCVEGGYSSNPYDGYTRISEFKALVHAYNKAGINIIMDVVYNHVDGTTGSNFDVLMPGYYYRYDSKGNLSNGSGCGNETASDMPMFSKFMVDSTQFWAEEYKLGGFRFDLMGLHDLETMNNVTSNLKLVNPSIAVYGEPWSGGTSTLSDSESAKQINGNKYVGYGQFNDQTRDALIKGGLNSSSAKGWITNDTSKISSDDSARIQAGIKGQTYISGGNITDPNKTVNYVTCHDNYTLSDRIKASGITDSTKIKKMAMLANSMVFTTQGVNFMLAGEEFLRTKKGNSNSYNASYEVNELDYSLKVKNIDMFNNYKKLISFKQNIDGMHLEEAEAKKLDYEVSYDANEFIINIKDISNNKIYKIVHANGYNASSLDNVDLAGYTLYLDTLDSNKILSNSTKINAFETIIAYK